MNSWFAETIDQPFQPFSSSHISMLILYFVGIVALFYYHKKIIQYTKLYDMIRWMLFLLLFSSELLYQVWAITNGVWGLRGHIPLHLCGIASLIAMVTLVTRHEKLIAITFFFGLIPAFMALITPDLPHNFQHFRFWKFFIHHIAISWTSIFLIATSSTRLKLKSIVSSYVLLILYALVIGLLVNPLLDSNYLYLANKPMSTTPLDFLGSGFTYYINLGLLVLFVFLVQFFIYVKFKNKDK